jgi:hypothetical protein
MTSNQLAYWANQEKIRSNKAIEAETMRHNLEQEKIGATQAAASMLGAQASASNANTNRLLYNESVRHNTALESIQDYGAKTQRFGSVVSALTGLSDTSTRAYEAETHRMGVEGDLSLVPYKQAQLTASAINQGAQAADTLIGAAGTVVSSLLGLGGK